MFRFDSVVAIASDRYHRMQHEWLGAEDFDTPEDVNRYTSVLDARAGYYLAWLDQA